MTSGDKHETGKEAAVQAAMLKRAFEAAFDAEARATFDVRLRADRTDLANETADRTVGRAKRFLTDVGDGVGDDREDSRRRKRQFVSELQFLLQTDAAYRELYDHTQRKISEAEHATQTALDMVERLIAKADDAIARAERGTQHVNGEPVFMDEEGRVYTADGRLIHDDIAARIEWRGDEMSREEYLKLRQNRGDLGNERDGILFYQTDILGRARDRMHSDNDPPKPDEIHEIMDGIETGMPSFVRDVMDAPTEPERPLNRDPETLSV